MADLIPNRLPEDVLSERSILATLASPGAVEGDSAQVLANQKTLLGLRPEHFMAPQHRPVLEAMQDLFRARVEIHALTIRDWLETRKFLGAVGGFAGLTELLASDELGRPQVLAAILLEKWRLRELGKRGYALSQAAFSESGRSLDLLQEHHQALSAIQVLDRTPAVASADELLDKIMAGEAFRVDGDADRQLWLGLEAFDFALDGEPGHLWVLAARPGVGKTALAIQGAWDTALRGQCTLLVSLEMEEWELRARIASWHCHVPARDFRKGRWSDQTARSLMDPETRGALSRIKTWCHPSGLPWEKLEAAIREAVRAHGVSSVWIDYFTLIAQPTHLGKNTTDAARWAVLSGRIRDLAKELRVAIVLLSQLNRDGDGEEPKLRDLKETGALEQDAWAVVMLWPKDRVARDDQQPTREVWAKLEKNRSGAAGFKRLLKFTGTSGRFEVLARETNETPTRRRA